MEIAKASGASIFLNMITSKETSMRCDKLYFYCDFNLAHCHRHDQQSKHGLQYQIDKYESQIKDSPRDQATFFDCEIEFEALRVKFKNHKVPLAVE